MVRRLEPLHLSLSSPCWLVRNLRPVVEMAALTMLNLGQDLSFGGRIALQLVCYNHPGQFGSAAEQLPEEAFGRLRVALLLHQDVENYPVLINGSPAIMDLASDPDEDFIQVPFISMLRPPPLKGRGIVPTKTDAPFTDAFIADDHASSRQDRSTSLRC